MDDNRQLQVSRVIDAPPERIFAVLADPARHRELDSAGMLRGLDSGDAPVTAVGQAFVMNMNQDGIGDYQMRSEVVVYEADRRIGWAPAMPSILTISKLPHWPSVDPFSFTPIELTRTCSAKPGFKAHLPRL